MLILLRLTYYVILTTIPWCHRFMNFLAYYQAGKLIFIDCADITAGTNRRWTSTHWDHSSSTDRNWSRSTKHQLSLYSSHGTVYEEIISPTQSVTDLEARNSIIYSLENRVTLFKKRNLLSHSATSMKEKEWSNQTIQKRVIFRLLSKLAPISCRTQWKKVK